MAPSRIKVQRDTVLVVWFNREYRCWYGSYEDAEGNQLGDAWTAPTRDYVLIFRPEVPKL